MSALSRAVADLSRRTAPFITYYDLRAPERTELSGVTATNWVAKTSNMLVDGFGAERAQRVRLALPSHWETFVWLLASWRVGLEVTDGEAEFAAVGPEASGEEETVFALSLRPMGLRFAEPPGGALIDYNAEVLSYGDDFVPLDAPEDTDAAVTLGGVTMTHAEMLTARDASRVLLEPGPLDRDVRVLARALVGGGSLVVVANASPADLERIATEENAAFATDGGR